MPHASPVHYHSTAPNHQMSKYILWTMTGRERSDCFLAIMNPNLGLIAVIKSQVQLLLHGPCVLVRKHQAASQTTSHLPDCLPPLHLSLVNRLLITARLIPETVVFQL